MIVLIDILILGIQLQIVHFSGWNVVYKFLQSELTGNLI